MKRKTEQQFNNRIRFNWGFHDAVQCVQMKWDQTGDCFAVGFIKSLPVTPEAVIAQHPDKSYAQGWAYGYRAAKAGTCTSNSEPAWIDYQQKGK